MEPNESLEDEIDYLSINGSLPPEAFTLYSSTRLERTDSVASNRRRQAYSIKLNKSSLTGISTNRLVLKPRLTRCLRMPRTTQQRHFKHSLNQQITI